MKINAKYKANDVLLNYSLKALVIGMNRDKKIIIKIVSKLYYKDN